EFSPLSTGHNERTAEREFQLRFGGDVQFLAFGQDLNCGCATAANAGANRRGFAASGNSSNRGSDTRTDGSSLGGLLSAAFAHFTVFGGSHRVRNSVDDNLRQLEAQLRRSFQAACVVDVGNAAANVGATRNHLNASLGNRFIK